MRRIQTIDGLPVHDATEPLLIEVLPVDIKSRRRKDPEHCAVAEACKRELHCTEARVYLSRLYVRQSDHWLRYEMPTTIRSEIQTFDRGGGFSTGSYRIIPPRPSKRVGMPKRGGNNKTNSGGGKPITQRHVTGIRQSSPLTGGAIEPGKH
jgi:hypothetical protein